MAQAFLSTRPVQQRPVSYCDLCRALSNTPTTVTWCQRQKLLATDMDCHACGRDMRLVKRKSPEGQGWRCPRKVCRKEVTLRKNTFFAGSHLQLELILRLILPPALQSCPSTSYHLHPELCHCLSPVCLHCLPCTPASHPKRLSHVSSLPARCLLSPCK